MTYLFSFIFRESLICGDPNRILRFQADYLKDLSKECGYEHDLDSTELFVDLSKVTNSRNSG